MITVTSLVLASPVALTAKRPEPNRIGPEKNRTAGCGLLRFLDPPVAVALFRISVQDRSQPVQTGLFGILSVPRGSAEHPATVQKGEDFCIYLPHLLLTTGLGGVVWNPAILI